jgi:molybdate transport system substrate-binding protein
MTNPSLVMLSSMATRELLAELAVDYHARTGVSVDAQAAGGVDVAKRVQAGEAADLVVLAANAIDKLIADGKLLGGRVDLVKSGIAIAVRAGAPHPAIASEEEVKAAVVSAKTLSFSTGPSGVYLEKMFARWGVLEEVRPRIVVPPPGIAVGSLVADGAAELGFQQLSELQSLPGIDLLGPLPAAIQSITIFSGGIAAASRETEAARALLDFLAAPAAAATKRKHGMESV